MTDFLHATVKAVAKGSGWSAKRDILVKDVDDWALAVHPRRGAAGVIEFRAKPRAWDRLLWSILQIDGNDAMPVSFHFTGAFTLDTPALLQEDVADHRTPAAVAQQIAGLARRGLDASDLWRDHDLDLAIAQEEPQQPWRYHMTRVVRYISAGNRNAAVALCRAAMREELDVRRRFQSPDMLADPGPDGRWRVLDFFQLAELWMQRNG